MCQYRNIIDEKDYCDEADLLLNQYRRSSPLQFQAELDLITRWLQTDSTAPLVIIGPPQSGKKTLLCSLLANSKSAHPNWLYFTHFASVTPHYAHILYKTMSELRNHFQVEQRVDLNDQKLRRYFKYWLEVISDLIQKEYLGYSKSQVPKVVIVVEGVDQCIDAKGIPVQSEFWLPNQIPKNIKLILTTKFITQNEFPNATIVQHHLSHDKRSKIIDRLLERTKIWAKNVKQPLLYQLHILDEMCKIKPNFQPSGSIFQKVLHEYVSAVATNTFPVEQMLSLLYILTLTRKGLRAKWAQRMVNISIEKWGLFLRFFSFFVIESNQYYIICNGAARTMIRELVDSSGEKERTYRQSIAHQARNEAVHLRELEEVVTQLYLSECHSELKEVISRVQNFAMLYTPLSKDLLCQCWVKLQHLEAYDPVFEYNKAIEAYKSHYYPREEDLYKIIFQISMFFKEYAEFQNAKTPQFRHPLIRGETDQLVEIGIFDQLKSLSMVGKCKVYKLKPVQASTKKQRFSTEHKKETLEDVTSQTKRKITKLKTKKSLPKDSSQCSAEASRPYTSSSVQQQETIVQPSKIEELNVSIAANQQKFRNYFTKSMREYLQNYFTPLKKCTFKEKQLSFQSNQSENEDQIGEKVERQVRLDVEKIKDSLILKKFKEYLEQSYHKTGEQVQFYYYKQWIWLQFPWICQTVRHTYSQMIKECLPGSIHFMSPSQEFKLVKEVLKIARTAKQSKMSIFTEKRIEILPIKCSPQKLQELEAKKKTKTIEETSTVSRMRHTHDVQVKQTMNLAKIDEFIYTEKQYQQTHRKDPSKALRGQASMPNFHTFVTQAGQAKPLPSINKSKFARETRGQNRQKENLNQSKDHTLIVRKYNEVKHENDMLLHKIEEMRRLASLQLSKTKEERDEITQRLTIAEDRKQTLEKNYSQQALLQKKLQVIIKICDLNKMYGSESEYLSAYLSNLRQMISLEQNRVKQLKSKISDVSEAAKNEIKQLRRRRKQLKIAKQQQDRYLNMGTDSTNPQYLCMPLEQIQQQLREMDKSTKTKSKQDKNKIQHYLSSDDYQLLQSKLGFNFGDSQNETKLQSYIDSSSKRKQLILKNNQLSAEIKISKDEIDQLKSNLKNLKQINQNQRKLVTANSLTQTKYLLNKIKDRTRLIQDALIILQSH